MPLTPASTDTRCFGHRMLSPFRGVMHSVVTGWADAVTTDGRNWTLYVHGECLYDDLETLGDTAVTVPDVKYGSWSADEGFRRAPIRMPTFDARVCDEGERLLAAVKRQAARLPFADGSLAGVTGAFWLQLMPDPAEALCEAARVLAGGGVLALAVQAPEWREPDGARDADRLGLEGADRDHLVRCARKGPGTTRLPDAALALAAADAGLDAVDVTRHGLLPGVIVLAARRG